MLARIYPDQHVGTPLKVLLIEDSEDDTALLLRYLTRGGYEVSLHRTQTLEEMAQALDHQDWDIVIADYTLPKFDALTALALLKQRRKDIPFIIVSGNIGEDLAVEAMHAGAHDYIMKDNLARLLPAIKRELHEVEERTARKRAERMVQHLAYHDILTGLLNRREFEIRLTQALHEARTRDEKHALLYIDLDQFKIINDTCGHIAGDELLKQLTRVIDDTIPEGNILARLGGDEFGVLLKKCTLEESREIAQSILTQIQSFRFEWQGTSFEVGASIGIAVVNASSESLANLLSTADVACYAAKDMGRNRIHVYQESDTELTKRHGEMHWITRISTALEENRFRLYQQAIVPLKNDAGGKRFELLIRMEDEAGNLIAPGNFIPAAERYNLMPTLDRWVLQVAFAHYQQNQQSMQNVEYSINLSGTSINDLRFLDFLQKQLLDTGFPPQNLCLEITETAAITNISKATLFIEEFKKMGCHFALDDFGSGLSSFTYLKTLPVDYLKIDGYFIKDMIDNPIDCAIVSAINQVGQVMGMKTIAEFVENEQITKQLQQIGVDFAQGYGIEKPHPLTDNNALYELPFELK